MDLDNVFFYSAAIGGGVLAVQFLLIMVGVDDGGFGDSADVSFDADGLDADASTDASGFWFLEMISLRTLSAAAAFFGLVGGGAASMGLAPTVCLALACVAGYGAMYSVYWLFKQVFNLEVSGAQDIRGAIGLPGQVYVPIDPGATGKVHIVLQGRTVEYQAVSDLSERLATGAKIVVADVINNDTVRVEPADRAA